MVHLPLPGLFSGQAATPTKRPAAVGERRKSLSGGMTVSRQFVTSVRELMKELEQSSAHLVRCLKPNATSTPRTLHAAHVLDQLRYSGTTALLRMMHASFPTRIPYNELYSRYRPFVPRSMAALEPAEFAETLALSLDVASGQ